MYQSHRPPASRAARAEVATANAQMAGLWRAGFVFISSLILLAALAMPGRAASQDQVQTFLKATGFDVALKSIKLSAAAGPQMLDLQDSGFETTWKVLTDDVFDETKLEQMGEKMIADQIVDDDMTFATDFYTSDLGKRLVAAENDSHMDTDQDRSAKAQKVLADLMDKGDSKRVKLLDRLNAAVDAADDSEDSMAEVQFRFLKAARDAGVIDFNTDDQTLHDQLVDNAKAGKDDNRMNALINSAYTYRDFSDAELAKYAKALENPHMQKVYKLMNKVQFDVMANRFEAAAAKLKGVKPSTEL